MTDLTCTETLRFNVCVSVKHLINAVIYLFFSILSFLFRYTDTKVSCLTSDFGKDYTDYVDHNAFINYYE